MRKDHLIDALWRSREMKKFENLKNHRKGWFCWTLPIYTQVHSLTRELLVYRIDQWWCKKRRNKSDRKMEIGLYLVHYSGMRCYIVSVLNIALFQIFCHSCFCAFYTTIGQSYKPTTLSLENVFIYLFHISFLSPCHSSIVVNNHN